MIPHVPSHVADIIQSQKILFGHQSVGNNLINGIHLLTQYNPSLRINIVQLSPSQPFTQPALGHFLVGSNGNPRSKCDAFRHMMESGTGNATDIAFFKFCYADINASTNVFDILSYYVATMESLKQQFPDVTFIHLTVPLTVCNQSLMSRIKSILKSLMQIPDNNLLANVKRNQYNNMLIETYDGKEPIFDLAAVESTAPNGDRQTFVFNSSTYFSLVPSYSDDGGHLNTLGQIKAAEALLLFLARCAGHV